MSGDFLDESRSQHYDIFLFAVIVINALAAFFAICCNFVVVYIISKTPSLQTPSNILILGLAISDFIVGILSQPFFCLAKYFYVARDIDLFCTTVKVYDSSVNSLGTVSFLTLSAITADRYLAVYLHLRYLELVTVRRYGIVLVCIWSVQWRIIFLFREFKDVFESHVVEFIFSSIGALVFVILLLLLKWLFNLQNVSDNS
jgi:hypothetical protein